MTENGPAGIYRIKPLYDFNPLVELPTCMYKLKSIYDTSESQTSGTESNGQHEVNGSQNEDEEMVRKQLEIIKKLEALKSEVLKLKKELNISELAAQPVSVAPANKVSGFKPQDIVVKANPEYPPYSIWVFLHLVPENLQVQLVTYTHSSLASVPATVKQLSQSRSEGTFDLTLTVIWKDIGKDQEMMVDPVHQGVIEAEVNIARYLARLLAFGYDSDPFTALQVDFWLELAHSSIIHGSNKARNAALKSMNSHLGNNSYLVGSALSLADVVMWSTLLQCKLNQDLPSNVSKWWKLLTDIPMFGNLTLR